MRRALKLVWHLMAVVGILTILAGAWIWQQGIDTRTPPSSLETTVARTARRTMIPSEARRRQAPEPGTAETLRDGLAHWADHCASCHANDGSGQTEMGQGLFPRAPDMRLPATQSLTDGELFYIIEQGVKLTGMPAWGVGTPEGERSSWHLVQFIRHLPSISEAELAEMDALNPRGADAWRALEEERRFLAGEPPLPPAHRH